MMKNHIRESTTNVNEYFYFYGFIYEKYLDATQKKLPINNI